MASFLAELAVFGCSMATVGISMRLDVNQASTVDVTEVFSSFDSVKIEVSAHDLQLSVDTAVCFDFEFGAKVSKAYPQSCVCLEEQAARIISVATSILEGYASLHVSQFYQIAQTGQEQCTERQV